MSECSQVGFFGDFYLTRVIHTAAFFVFIPYCVVALLLFVYKRKRQPLVARPFRTTVAGFIFMLLWMSELSFTFILTEGHSCFVFLLLGWPLLTLALNVYLSRAWLLWFKFKSTQEKSTLPPLINVTFSMKNIRKRVDTYKKRRRSTLIGNGFESLRRNRPLVDFTEAHSPSSQRRRSKSATGAHAPMARSMPTAARAPVAPTKKSISSYAHSVELHDYRTSALHEADHDREFGVQTGEHCDAPASVRTRSSSTRSSMVGSLRNGKRRSAHARSGALTFSVTLANLQLGADEFEFPTSPADHAHGAAVDTPTPVSPRMARFSHSDSYSRRRLQSRASDASSASGRGQLLSSSLQKVESTVYEHISNVSSPEPSRSSSTSDSGLVHAAKTRSSADDSLSKAVAAAVAPIEPSEPVPKAIGDDTPQAQTPVMWYLNHKHYASDRFMLKWFGLKAFVECAVLLSPVYVSNGAVFHETYPAECFCPSLTFALYAFQAIIGYHALFVGYAAWRFAKIKDGFYEKAEFKYISIICLAGVVVWNVFNFLPQNDNLFPFGNFWMILATVAVYTMSSVYPLWISRKRGMRAVHSTASSVSYQSFHSLASIGGSDGMLYAFLLETDDGMKEFTQHLKKEFSIENLLFWQAVEQYHSEFKDDQPKENRKLAVEIESRFIDDESELQVNLNSGDYRSIRENIAADKITADLFDTASSHIFHLMATDSFVRFRNQRRELFAPPAEV